MKSTDTISSLTERLRRLDSCAVSDAMDRVGLTGVVSGIRPLTGGGKIAGPVRTIQLACAAVSISKRHLGTASIESGRPGEVLVVANEGRIEAGSWGGLLSVAARKREIAAVIVDGACRDIDEIRADRFPVFARSAVPISARGRWVEFAVDCEISIDEVSIEPGDLVIGDGSGVVFIPAEKAEEIVSIAESIDATEKELRKRIESGEPVSKVLGRNYEEMTK